MTVPDQPGATAADTPGERSTAVASAKHQGLHRPNDDRRVEQALEHVGLEDLGDVLEDQLRDRRSRGAPPPQDPQPDRNDAAPD